MAIFAILRLILSFYSNTKAAYTSSISAVRENRSPSNHQIFLADTNIFFCNFPPSFRSKTATFRQGAVSVQETWKFESCDRECVRSDDVRVEKMGRGIKKRRLQTMIPTFAASALGFRFVQRAVMWKHDWCTSYFT